MSEQTIDLKKRRFLTKATSVVGAVGVSFAAWPFLSTWKPSAKAKAAGAPVDVDISKLEAGQLVRVLWRKKPVWIFKRDEKALESLDSEDLSASLLTLMELVTLKANSLTTLQQTIAQLKTKKVLLLLWAFAHISDALQHIDQSLVQLILVETVGKAVFIVPCHGSKFDLAGRVYAGVPAPTNLVIPPYQYVTDSLIRVGVDQQNT